MGIKVLNYFQSPDWKTWVPTFTAPSGTFTTITVNNAVYRRVGNKVDYELDFTITNKGTASGGTIYATLPLKVASPKFAGAGRENVVTAKMVSVITDSANTRIEICLYDAAVSVITNNYNFSISGSYWTI